MAQKCAFEAADEAMTGATVNVGDGVTYDIAAELKAGNGQIVLDTHTDRHIVDALNVHPAVKSTAVKTVAKGK